MDPITLILTALAAGASAIASGSLGEAGADAYNKIKDLIKKRLSRKKSGELIFEEYENDPEVWKQPLLKSLQETGVVNDEQIIALAQVILKYAGDTYKIVEPGGILIEGNFLGNIYQGPPPQDEARALNI